MKEFLKKQKNRRGSAGFTLVELLVAVAILGVAVTAIGGFLISGIRSYSSTSAEAKLQNEAQMAVNQIEDIVIDAGLGVSYNVVTSSGDHFVENDGGAPEGEAITAKYLYVFNWNDARDKVEALLIKYDPTEQKLYYYESEVANATGGDGASLTIAMAMDVTAVTDWALLAEGVTDFSIDMSQYASTKQIHGTLSLEKRNKTYTTAINITLRNDVLVNAERISEIYERVDVVEITTITGIELRTSTNSTMKGGNIQLSTKVTGTGYPSQSIYRWTVEEVTGGTAGKDENGFITITGEVLSDVMLFDSLTENASYPVIIDPSTKVLNVSTACNATTLKITAYCFGKDAEGNYLSASRYINVKSIASVTLQPTPDYNDPANDTLDKTNNTFAAASYSVAMDTKADASTQPEVYKITAYPGNKIKFAGAVIGEGNSLDAEDQRLTWEIKNMTSGVTAELDGTEVNIGRYSQQGSFIVEITPVLNTNIKVQYLVNVGTKYDSNNNALKILNAGNANRGGSRALGLTMNGFQVDELSDYDWSIEAITANSGVQLNPGSNSATISSNGVVTVSNGLAYGLEYQITVKAAMKSNPEIMATTVVNVPAVKLELTKETIQSSKGAVIYSLNDTSSQANYYRSVGGESLECVVTGIENYELTWKVATETNANAYAAITPNKSFITGDTGTNTVGSRVNSATLSISNDEVVQYLYVKVSLNGDASFYDTLYVTLYGGSTNQASFTGLKADRTAIYRGDEVKITPEGSGTRFRMTDVSDWNIDSPSNKTGLTLTQNADGTATLKVTDSFKPTSTTNETIKISAKYLDGQTQVVSITVYKNPVLDAKFTFTNDKNATVTSILRGQELKVTMSGLTFDRNTTATWAITGLKYQNNDDRNRVQIKPSSSTVAYIAIMNFEFDLSNHADNEIYFTLTGKVNGRNQTVEGSIKVTPVSISVSGPTTATTNNAATYTYTAEVSGIYSGANFSQNLGDMKPYVNAYLPITWKFGTSANTDRTRQYTNNVENWTVTLKSTQDTLKSTASFALSNRNNVRTDTDFYVNATVGVANVGSFTNGTQGGTKFTVTGPSVSEILTNPTKISSGWGYNNDVMIGGDTKNDFCWYGDWHKKHTATYNKNTSATSGATYYRVKYGVHNNGNVIGKDHYKYDTNYSYYARYNNTWYKWYNNGWVKVSDTEKYPNDNSRLLKDVLNLFLS